ncbi:MarR family winged helix-turn-helix transcriptional regulator [Paraburkholderia sp. DHOC27]|uniref:MarR family winged helix-turn-helix transcriptional regulator n=1 Tax=Paraburkholderia sp. DHOC27 TaxID=2303330 RepID=UPI000E3DD015|nr:MarR family transcriptional regulator [Paraburkholderia sp. DHOC27]RFU49167.1 MarR family transcriptional regulator [Paraburkholderia sp. DHOC27]
MTNSVIRSNDPHCADTKAVENDVMDGERYGPVFMRAARYIVRVYNRHLADMLLTASQHAILEALGKSGPIALQDLADELVVERSALQRTLQPLKKTGLVRSLTDSNERRRPLYQLTDEGRSLLESSAARVCSAEAEIEQLFDRSDIPAVRDGLVPVANAFREKVESIS